jgi:hypothetical protein
VPFDWRTFPRGDVAVERDFDIRHSGKSSLRIQFNSRNNASYHQTYQDTVLAPGTYRISAYFKTGEITSDQGLRLHIFDPTNEGRFALLSDTLTGTHDWTLIEKSFTVPNGVPLVRVDLARMESMMMDNKISGTAWIDDVKISKQ